MGLGKAYIAGRRQPTGFWLAGAKSHRHPRAAASRPPWVRAPAGTAPATPGLALVAGPGPGRDQ